MYTSNISVFLPAYNEEENIQDSVLSIWDFLKKNFKKFEIIIINDGSRDKTPTVVLKLAKKYKEVRLINHKTNLGYGAALRTGFKNSKYEVIFYTDADNQFDIRDLKKVIPLLKTYDIVSAYRMKREDPLMRIFIAYVYNLIIRILFNLKVRDIDASFKLYKKNVFNALNLKSNTGLIDAEVLIKAERKGFKIGQMGVKHYPRLKGRTMYEVGKRNKVIAFVRPQVITDILKEIGVLWKEIH